MAPKWVCLDRQWFATLPKKKKVVEFFGSPYILDSCVLGEFHLGDSSCGHVICGITCHRNPYVFNGWIMGGAQEKHSCPFEAFDWKTINQDFSLSNKKCMMEPPNPKKMIFNFHKGDRNLIYVKTRSTGSLADIQAVNAFCSGPKKQAVSDMICDPKTKKKIFRSDPKAEKILQCLEDIAFG